MLESYIEMKSASPNWTSVVCSQYRFKFRLFSSRPVPRSLSLLCFLVGFVSCYRSVLLQFPRLHFLPFFRQFYSAIWTLRVCRTAAKLMRRVS